MSTLSATRNTTGRESTNAPGRLRKYVSLWMLLPALAVLLVLQVYPTIYAVYLSLTRQRRGEFEFMGLTNFELLLNNSDFHDSVWRTITFSFWYVVLTIGLGLLVAILVNRRVRFSGWYLVVIFVPWVLSDVVAGTMWRWMFLEDYGLLQDWLRPIFGDSIYINPDGAMGIVIAASIWRAVAFTAILFLGALQTVPAEVLESAALDGASRFQSFWRVTFPIIQSTFLIALLLTTIRSVNTVGLILATTRGGPGDATTTMATFLYRVSWGEGNFARGAAVSVVMFIFNVALAAVYLWIITRQKDKQS
ncbi:MAG: sugar ABC transporter permease [Chloroflexota bacterium]|nr:sugar ABC transporter permease [Chloroflexota bacterium]